MSSKNGHVFADYLTGDDGRSQRSGWVPATKGRQRCRSGRVHEPKRGRIEQSRVKKRVHVRPGLVTGETVPFGARFGVVRLVYRFAVRKQLGKHRLPERWLRLLQIHVPGCFQISTKLFNFQFPVPVFQFSNFPIFQTSKSSIFHFKRSHVLGRVRNDVVDAALGTRGIRNVVCAIGVDWAEPDAAFLLVAHNDLVVP